MPESCLFDSLERSEANRFVCMYIHTYYLQTSDNANTYMFVLDFEIVCGVQYSFQFHVGYAPSRIMNVSIHLPSCHASPSYSPSLVPFLVVSFSSCLPPEKAFVLLYPSTLIPPLEKVSTPTLPPFPSLHAQPSLQKRPSYTTHTL